MIDIVTPRKELKSVLAKLIAFTSFVDGQSDAGKADSDE